MIHLATGDEYMFLAYEFQTILIELHSSTWLSGHSLIKLIAVYIVSFAICSEPVQEPS